MKHLLFFLLFAAVSVATQAQSAAYSSAMTSAIGQLGKAKTADDFVACANSFHRIAASEPTEWLPGYYDAYARLIAGFQTSATDMAKAQGLFDEAQKALAIAAKNAAQPADASEIAALQAYIYTGKVIEDPMVIGQQLSPKVFQELGKAYALNPANPRAAHLKGMYTLNMPDFYGGGAANARPHLEKAQELYAAEQPDGFRPRWGRERNARLLEEVKR